MNNNDGFGIDFSIKSPANRKKIELLQAREKKAAKRWARKKKESRERRKNTPRRGFFSTYVNGKAIPNAVYDKRHPGILE